MKIRISFVSNSSSSSFVCFIDKNIFEQFMNDFKEYQEFLHKLFPRLENEWFEVIKKDKKSIKEQVIDYIKESEGVRNPSDDMIEFFTMKLKKNGYFDNQNEEIEIEYEIDTEAYDIRGFQNLCEQFILNYESMRKK